MATAREWGRALWDRLRSTASELLRGRPDPVVTRRRLEQSRALYDARATALADALAQQQLDPFAWFERMAQQVRELHLRNAIIAVGDFGSLSSAQLEIITQQINEQIETYLSKWLADMLSGAFPMDNAAKTAARARLYGGAANATFERSTAQSQGLPDLPFYATQRSRCRSNCRCSWVINDLGSGNYDCFWVLGEAEHCPQCVARRRAANPLKVRNGAIVNPERYQAQELYA